MAGLDIQPQDTRPTKKLLVVLKEKRPVRMEIVNLESERPVRRQAFRIQPHRRQPIKSRSCVKDRCVSRLRTQRKNNVEGE